MQKMEKWVTGMMHLEGCGYHGAQTQHGQKSYELSNPLGNVMVVISDRGALQSAQDYYPFGMAMPKRSSGAYRYGFNGKETDPETGIQDYGMRWYLPNIARFPSVDPLTHSYPWYTPYQFAGNKPIWAIDLDGLEDLLTTSLTYCAKALNKCAFGRVERSKYLKEYWEIAKFIHAKNPDGTSKFANHSNFIDQQVRLSLNESKQPSAAVKSFVERPSEYSIDCGEFVQICVWYGMLRMNGDKSFDSYMQSQINENAPGYNKMGFTLGMHSSTGISSVETYSRAKLEQTFMKSSNEEIINDTEDQLLERLPVGSRVMLFNAQAAIGDDFQMENMIKVGQDQYAAHALRRGVINIYTLKEAKTYLAKHTNQEPSPEYINKNIFVTQMEIYKYEIKE